MLKYTIKRFIAMLVTLFIICSATFFILAAIPGDAISDKIEKFPPEVQAKIYEKYGMDKPLMERYVSTMKGIAQFDFGPSLVYQQQTVQQIIKEKLPVSARLGLQQMFLGITVGLSLGIVAAMKKGTKTDYIVVTIAVLLASAPSFVFSVLLQKFVAGDLGLFPIMGWPKGDAMTLWFGGWKYTILPTLAGCFGYIASYSRLMKTSMLDTINQDYILTAKSKGLSQKRIIISHILRNSFIPIITVLPMAVAFSITGSFFIERVFSIPGVGMYMVGAVLNRDVPLIMGITVLLTAIYIIVIFLTDLLYTVVDPRIRIAGKKR
ncbi:MAG: ABC transporter permease [Clostridium sp.]